MIYKPRSAAMIPIDEQSEDINHESGSIGTPVSELEIDAALVYRLLKDQYPDLTHLPIHLADAGWDNVMFRLGDRWAVRLPRRKAAARLIEHEQTWLPLLAAQLFIPIPTPYRFGTPSGDYPWRWSVLPWLEGVAADRQELHANQAKRLALFLRSLHVPAPSNAPQNAFWGVPLRRVAEM